MTNCHDTEAYTRKHHLVIPYDPALKLGAVSPPTLHENTMLAVTNILATINSTATNSTATEDELSG